MKTHSYINSNPQAFDSDCAICGGKCRDSIHGATNEIREKNANLALALSVLRAVADLANGQGRLNLLEVAGMARQAIAQAEGSAAE